MMRALLLIGLGALGARQARAEGSAELPGPSLTTDTVLYVDILDAADEVIRFVGDGRVTVTDPDGTSLGSFESGDLIVPTPGLDGAYAITFSTDQVSTWDLAVLSSAGVEEGRLYSYEWAFNSETYGEENALTASVYILVPTDAAGATSVIEMTLEGVTGWQWTLGVNGYGIEDGDGRSQVSYLYDFVPSYPVYLNPPARASFTAEAPLTGELTVTFPDSDCDGVVPGEVEGEFRFEASGAGAYHLVCDLDRDGVYDMTSDDDLTLSGEAVEGLNVVPWDGRDNGGGAVLPGDYACRVSTTVGEVHYVAEDIETAWPGIRMFAVDAAGQRTGLAMFWNDAAVQANAVTMPDGQVALETSGADGLDSGVYGTPTLANDNARAWGDFTEWGKGNLALLDTFTYLHESASGEVTVTVIDPDTDDCWQTDTGGSGDTGPADTGGSSEDTAGPVEDAPSGYYAGGRLCATSPAGGGVLALAALALALATRRRDED